MSVCILISTCEKYRRLAEFTGRMIVRYWADHPPLFFSGCPEGPAEHWLPLKNHPADWMGITRNAVEELARRGHRQCYLILDDHPPLFHCNEFHLNATLPELMKKLGAVYIGLNGWGQGKAPNGVVLGREFFWLENVSSGFLWKFQLHPALWNLDALGEILDVLMRELPPEARSPWAFERRAGNENAKLRQDLKRRAYRVCGERMSRSRLRTYGFKLERLGFRTFRFAVGKLFGQDAWSRVDERYGFVLRYYDGPYPLLWSGATRKGQINPEFLRYLKTHFKKRYAEELSKVLDTPTSVHRS